MGFDKEVYKKANKEDIWSLMALYQKLGSTFTEDGLFLAYDKMLTSIVSPESLWLLCLDEQSDTIYSVVAILLDRDLGIAKITRMMVNPDVPDASQYLRKTIRKAIEIIENEEPLIEIIYSTTLSLPLHLQAITLDVGFHILGVFPNALGVDQSKLNGLTVYYKKGILEKKRQKDLIIHKSILPFFKLAQSEFHMESVQTQETSVLPFDDDYEDVPSLELIRAPKLVANKINKLKANQSMSVNFFPFLTPNTMIVDPDETIQIYIRIVKKIKFAAIIGEHFQKSVNPVETYEKVLQLLREENVTYVEVINDAGDVFGTECFLKAGFTPSAYIPAFKGLGASRRDYIVFTRSFDYLCRPGGDVPARYLDFFTEYWKLEKRNYFTLDAEVN